jgi:enterochelin esterase family protein
MRLVLAAVLLAATVAPADEAPLSPRLQALARRIAAEGPAAALPPFWSDLAASGTPIVEPTPDRADYSYVTFVWHGRPDTKDVLVTTLEQYEIRNPDLLEHARMVRLAGTDVWFKTQRMRNDTRLTYQFSPDDPLTFLGDIPQPDWAKRTAAFLPDPLNRRRLDTRNGPSSVLELPAAPAQPWLEPLDGVPAGRLEPHAFRSDILGNERTVTVYRPAGVAPAALLVFFDADTYLGPVPAPVILDNLIARGRIPPVLAMFVGNGSGGARGRELAYGEEFQDALARELVPWVRRTYGVSTEPSQTVVIGSSLGASAAVFSGLRHPEIFGNVLAQSGGFHFPRPMRDAFRRPLPGQLFEEDAHEYEWIVRQFVKAPRAAVRFYLEAGLREEAGWRFPVAPYAMPSLVGATRHLRDVLEAKGYEVLLDEYAGGHEVLCWRGSLADGLIALIGTPRS